MIETRDDGTGVGTKFGAEGVGIRFERDDVAARPDDFIFVDGAFIELGEIDFPDAGGSPGAHGMNAAVPMIEIPDDADASCAGGPDREVNAPNAFERYDMGAEFLVSVIVAAFAHEVEVEFAEYNGKSIRI